LVATLTEKSVHQLSRAELERIAAQPADGF